MCGNNNCLWIILILILFSCCGNGFGGNGCGCGCANDGYTGNNGGCGECSGTTPEIRGGRCPKTAPSSRGDKNVLPKAAHFQRSAQPTRLSPFSFSMGPFVGAGCQWQPPSADRSGA